MRRSKTCILVVTHNHEETIEKLVASLDKFNYQNVYFCDAASSDKTLEHLKGSRYREHVLVKEVLEGFSKNNNDLIRHFNLKAEYFLLLNPDTYFDEDFLKVLEDSFQQHSNCGIVAPLIKYPDETIQITWKSFPGPWTVLRKRLGLLRARNEQQMRGPYIDWCLGACMLISSKLMKPNQTLLDERYRLYCEDIDVCFETWRRGMKVVGVEACTVYHELNESSSKRILSKFNFWNVSSILKFFLKWNVHYFRLKKSLI